MTLPHIPDPMPGDVAAADAIEAVIVPRAKDIGGLEVRRALPSAQRQMIGPFIFLDAFGPVVLRAGHGMDVRPHPHIGLATVTWLHDGVVQHRDSLGSDQVIRPGALNWMTAGRGIVHSERTPAKERSMGQTLSGIQSWVALPGPFEDSSPAFEHIPADELPVIEDRGRKVRVVAGSLYGATSPVRTLSELFFAEVSLEAGARLPFPPEHEERGIYILEGSLTIAEQKHEARRLLVLRAGDDMTIASENGARFMLLGGEPMDGPRHIWWNFVSSSRDKIEAAKNDWKHARFDIVPGDETEFVLLPT